MADSPKLMTFDQVLKNLQGIRGRTFLLDHLKNTPLHAGGPTHRRFGRRIVFYPEDYERLLQSLENQPEPVKDPARNSSSRAPPSAEKAYLNVLKLVSDTRGKGLSSGGRKGPRNKA